MPTADEPVDYASRSYWERRYERTLSGEVDDARGPTFEWLAPPADLVRARARTVTRARASSRGGADAVGARSRCVAAR